MKETHDGRKKIIYPDSRQENGHKENKMADYAGGNSMATLNGNFKERYADKMRRLIPEGYKAINMIPFLPKDRQPKYWVL